MDLIQYAKINKLKATNTRRDGQDSVSCWRSSLVRHASAIATTAFPTKMVNDKDTSSVAGNNNYYYVKQTQQAAAIQNQRQDGSNDNRNGEDETEKKKKKKKLVVRMKKRKQRLIKGTMTTAAKKSKTVAAASPPVVTAATTTNPQQTNLPSQSPPLRPVDKRLALSSRRRGLPTPKLWAIIDNDDKDAAKKKGQEKEEEGDDDDDDEFGDVDFLKTAGSDTLLAVEFLTRQPQQQSQQHGGNYENNNSISIPLKCNGQEMIRGCLECQLYNRLQQQWTNNNNNGNADGDIATGTQTYSAYYLAEEGACEDIVSRELQELLQSNTLRKLSATTTTTATTTSSLTVLIPTAQYIRACRDATLEAAANTDDATVAVDWFVHHLSDWTRTQISEAEFQQSYATDPIFSIEAAGRRQRWTLDRVLQTLLSVQLLMASYHNIGATAATTTTMYQLWLPTWGMVLKAWEKCRSRLMQQLQRSAYKELSIHSLQQQQYSPIPTNIMVEWLVANNQVVVVQRPSGKFVKLLARR